MTHALDADEYDESQALTIKIPVAIPYAVDSHDFVRVAGTFQHEGEFYRLVKQRLLSDTLHIVCIKDQQSKRINQALTDYVKTFTDKPASDSQHVLTFSDFIKDYLTTTTSISSLNFGWQLDLEKSTSLNVFLSTYCSSIIHPPERA
jgi:hypothetical protein